MKNININDNHFKELVKETVNKFIEDNIKEIIDTVAFKINLSKIPSVDAEEEKEIEKILSNPDCWEAAETEQVDFDKINEGARRVWGWGG